MESKEDFLRIYLRERVGEGQTERERQRISSRRCSEHRAQSPCGIRSHSPDIMT